jgi:hypothetical protein
MLTSFVENFFFVSVKIDLTFSEFNSVHISSKKNFVDNNFSLVQQYPIFISYGLTIFGQFTKQSTNIFHHFFIIFVDSITTNLVTFYVAKKKKTNWI